MSAPVIVATQSVLEYQQWAPFSFQPYANNSPTAWNVSPLPPGVTFDPATGSITGPATMPGVYEIAFTAINTDGASTPVTFTIGIEAASALPPVDAVELNVDLGTGNVTATFPAGKQVARPNPTADGNENITPLFWLTQEDIRLLHIIFTKGGVVWDQDLVSLSLTLKAVQSGTELVTSNTMERAATGSATFFRMAVTVEGAALNGELGQDDDDDADGAACIAELEWTWTNGPLPVVGPDTLRTTSMKFFVGIASSLTN